MPFSVTQWPKNPDPRAPDYIIKGWNSGQVSPWKWDLATTGATGDLAVFNDVVRMHNVVNLPGGGTFVVDDTLPNDLVVALVLLTFDTVQTGPPTWTVQIQISIHHLFQPLYNANFQQLYPVALQVQGPIAMTEIDTTFGTIPNPMTITPVKWNSETA